MKNKSRILAFTLAFLISLSSISSASTVANAVKDLGKNISNKVDIEDVKEVTGAAVKEIATDGVEKGKEIVDKLDSEYSDDIKKAGAQTKSLWQRFVEWIKEAFSYIMHLFLFDSKDNLVGKLNEGVEKQNKTKTGNVLDDITNVANDRIANANLENLNISAIDKVTTKLPKVEVTKKNEKEEDLGEKVSIEEILNEASKKSKDATANDIKDGVKDITNSISQIGENIEKVGDTIDNLGTSLGDLIN